jgi:hypothetical protein
MKVAILCLILAAWTLTGCQKNVIIIDNDIQTNCGCQKCLPDLIVEDIYLSPFPIKNQAYDGMICVKVRNVGTAKTPSNKLIIIGGTISHQADDSVAGLGFAGHTSALGVDEATTIFIAIHQKADFMDVNTLKARAWVDKTSTLFTDQSVGDPGIIPESNEENNLFETVIGIGSIIVN